MSESKNEEFVRNYRRTLDEARALGTKSARVEQSHLIESSLCLLLERYTDDILPVESERFHKSFRQNDVVDNHAPYGCGGNLDMVIWNLLNCECPIFWKLQEDWVKKLAEEEVPREGD